MLIKLGRTISEAVLKHMMEKKMWMAEVGVEMPE